MALKPQHLYPWDGLAKPGDCFIIPGRRDQTTKDKLYQVPRQRGWRIRVRQRRGCIIVTRVA